MCISQYLVFGESFWIRVTRSYVFVLIFILCFGMMHIAVPECKLLNEPGTSSKFNAFSIHINGNFHADIRYSHLRRLHDSLKQNFGSEKLPEFPPKKIRHFLGENQLEDRRRALHLYLQCVAQNPAISSHQIFTNFFRDAQRTSFRPSTNNVNVEVFRCDGKKQSVRCTVDSSPTMVLEIYFQSIGASIENLSYFSLFLVRKGQGKTMTVTRWLKDFESPYLSLQLMDQKSGIFHKIYVKRSYWDISHELQMFNDPEAVKLIFAQATHEFNSGAISVPADILQRLRSLQQEGSFKEYIKLGHLQKRYGYWQLEPAVSDYPKPDTKVDLLVGNRQILLVYPNQATGELIESSFRVTRVKGWKLVYKPEGKSFTFMFEYLMARDRFEWISLESEQSVILSQCMQSMGAEILRSRSESCASTDSSPRSLPSTSRDSAVQYESFKEHFNISLPKAETSPTSNDAFEIITDDDL